MDSIKASDATHTAHWPQECVGSLAQMAIIIVAATPPLPTLTWQAYYQHKEAAKLVI